MGQTIIIETRKSIFLTNTPPTVCPEQAASTKARLAVAPANICQHAPDMVEINANLLMCTHTRIDIGQENAVITI